jgi:hypothetical protein
MKKLLVLVLTLLGALLPVAQASAFGFGSSFRAQWYPYYPPELTSLPQTYTCFMPEWREERVEVVVQRWQCKEVVDKVKVQIMVPRWEDQKQMQTYYTPVTREVEHDVVRCRWVPMGIVAPGTCWPSVCWQPETYVERVKTHVCEYRPEQRAVTVKACRWVPEDRVVEQRRLEWFSTPERISTVRHHCVLVPYTTQVCVPVLLPHYGPPVCPWGW